MNIDDGQLDLDEEEYITKTESYSTILSVQQPIPPKYKRIETKAQNAQCCLPCNNNRRKRRRFHWRRLLSYLPSWLKNSVPLGPSVGKKAAAASKSNPTVQILLAKGHTPMQSGHQQMDLTSSERRGMKTPSGERVLSNYNFDEQTSDENICCARCKQKGRSVCGRHSYTIECDSKQNTKPIQIGVAETSSQCKSKERTSNSSCAYPVHRKNKEARKSLIEINSIKNNCCQQCMGKRASTNSSCRESLLEQAWAYLQSIITDHRSDCPRCNQKQTSSNVNASASKDSSACKESLLEKARAYLNKITSEHKGDCQRCMQKPSPCYSSKENTSYLQTMLEQAWLYIKKLGSDPKSCCPHCKMMGRPVCCIHSSTRELEINNNSRIINNPSGCPPCCCTEAKQTPQSSSNNACNCQKTCPKPIENTSPDRPVRPPIHKSLEESTRCCTHNKHSSETNQAVYSGSHHKSCCLSRSNTDPPNIPSHQSFEALEDYKFIDKQSSQNLRNEIIGYHSSTHCSGPCSKSNSKDKGKLGLSLTMEPKDHKFCPRPTNCKHSKQSLESSSCNERCSGACNPTFGKKESTSKSSCNVRCSGACNPNFTPEPPKPPKPPKPPSKLSCEGGCVKCNARATATASMYQEQRMVDAEYEAFLDEQFGRMVARDMLDKETICDSDCDCMTCIGLIERSKGKTLF